jgi:putative hydrolase of the HAD superfamily
MALVFDTRAFFTQGELMSIRAIFFDADGTLLDFKKAEKEALIKLSKWMSTGHSLSDFTRAYHEVNTKMWMELEEGQITAEELKTQRFYRFAKIMDSNQDAQELSDFYLAALGEGHFYLKDAPELLNALGNRYPLVMVTNGLSLVQRARFKALEFDKIFHKILISEEEGSAKPETEMFKRGAEAIGMPLGSEILMVGDSLTSDIAGGIAAGISTCWFNPDRWENASPFKPDYEISNLMELLELLES